MYALSKTIVVVLGLVLVLYFLPARGSKASPGSFVTPQEAAPTPPKPTQEETLKSLAGTDASAKSARTQSRHQYSGCSPNDTILDRLAIPSKISGSQTTVRQELARLKARCTKGKLRDGRGKQIYLYSMVGCWGNPPEGYLEVLAKQEEEIKRLERKYTVIRVSCQETTNPRLIQ